MRSKLEEIVAVCEADLSGLREGDHCGKNCCIDKPNSGRLLYMSIKSGRMVESSRCSAEHRGSIASIDIYYLQLVFYIENSMFYINLIVAVSLLQLNLTIQRHFASGTLHRSAELIYNLYLFIRLKDNQKTN